jgi:hypothetical protein
VKNKLIRFRLGDQIVQECNALTNGDNIQFEWYNPRRQVKKKTILHIDMKYRF